MGPAALRLANLREALEKVGLSVQDLGDIEVKGPETEEVGTPSARYLEVVAKACREICERVVSSIGSGALPLVIGGDHSVAIGTASGIATALRDESTTQAPEFGFLWSLCLR